MMNEAAVRQLLAVLEKDAVGETVPLRVMAFSGGVSALKMVLEENE